MLALKDTSTSATASALATFSVRQPRAISTFGRFRAEEMGTRGAFSWGSLGKTARCCAERVRGQWHSRSPHGKGRERKECRLRGPDSVRGPRDREAEEEHLTRSLRAAGGAASRGVSPDPGPSRREPLRARELWLHDAPYPQAVLMNLQHPRSLSPIISWCRVCRDDGRDAWRSGHASSCGVVAHGESPARRTAGRGSD